MLVLGFNCFWIATFHSWTYGTLARGSKWMGWMLGVAAPGVSMATNRFWLFNVGVGSVLLEDCEIIQGMDVAVKSELLLPLPKL